MPLGFQQHLFSEALVEFLEIKKKTFSAAAELTNALMTLF